MLFAFLAPLGYLAALPAPRTPPGRPASAAACVGTVAAFVGRPRLRAHEIAIAGLPAAFDGYRMAQISDLHCGPFADGARVDAGSPRSTASGTWWRSPATSSPAARPSSRWWRPRSASCAAATASSPAWATTTTSPTVRRWPPRWSGEGLTLLRNRGVEVRRGGARLYVAGVDDTWTRRDNLDAALAGRPAGAPVLLLAHDPVAVPRRRRAGRRPDAVRPHPRRPAGRAVLRARFNLARIITRFTTGLYRMGAATLLREPGPRDDRASRSAWRSQPRSRS